MTTRDEIRSILGHDLLVLRRNRLLLAAAATLLLLAGLATWNGLARLQQRQALAAEIGQLEQESDQSIKTVLAEIDQNGGVFSGSSFNDPRAPSNAVGKGVERFAVLPVPAFSVLAVGQSDLLPYYYRLTARERQSLVHDAEIENAQVLYLGWFDWAFLLVFVVPLLAIALSYNLVSSEREGGTLALLRSSGLSFPRITLYRLGFRFLLLSLAVTALLALTLLLADAPIFSSNFALLAVLVWAYTALWFGLAFYVNSLGRSSGYNATLLVGTWLVLLVVLPALLNVVVERAHPMPSRIELITLNRELGDQIREEGSKLLSVYYEDHPELVPAGKQVNLEDFATKSYAVNEKLNQELAPVQARYATTLADQQRLVTNYRFASPAVLMQESLNELAGVGYTHYTDFERQVTDYHAALVGFVKVRVFSQSEMDVVAYGELPTFKYQPETHGGRDGGQWLNVAFLLTLAVVLLLLGMRRMNF